MRSFCTEMEGNAKNEIPQHPDEAGSSRPNFDSKALKMMEKMGYKTGIGLGKHEQGMPAPVQLSSQLGRGGLGLKRNSETLNETWDASFEDITVTEKAEWLINDTEFQFNQEDMKHWSIEDKPIEIMDDQCNFCEKETLINVLRAKDIFEEFDLKELNQARARANPFETIRAQFFMNRAALKMANIDAATDFIFTKIDKNPHHKNTPGPYYFADVCAGPGGFSEYILWRKKWRFKGFGLTLKNEHDFKLINSGCATSIPFQALYGTVGDGNVCCPENIADFRDKVRQATGGKGVHFMMSDGGFSVEGKENLQEVLSKNIYISQCLVALEILRTHGHFVTKVFDLFTCFSVGLLFLMYKCFEKVSILKPNSSRPANSERYFICCDLKDEPGTEIIKNYLQGVVERLWKLKDNHELDVTEIVPLEIIKNDNSFYNYITASNIKLAKRQAVSLRKLAVFCRNPSLKENRQDDLRQQCLNYWEIPKMSKVDRSNLTKNDVHAHFVREIGDLLYTEIHWPIKPGDLRCLVTDLSHWHYSLTQTVLPLNTCTFYVGFGQTNAYRYQRGAWYKMRNLQLVHGTILYGEFVKEVASPEAEEYRFNLHVIDALRLGDENVQHWPFEKRLDLIKVYCAAVNRDFTANAVRVRPKVFNKLEELVSLPDLITTREGGEWFSEIPPTFQDKREFFQYGSVVLLKTYEEIPEESRALRLYIVPIRKTYNYLDFKDLKSFVQSMIV